MVESEAIFRDWHEGLSASLAAETVRCELIFPPNVIGRADDPADVLNHFFTCHAVLHRANRLRATSAAITISIATLDKSPGSYRYGVVRDMALRTFQRCLEARRCVSLQSAQYWAPGRAWCEQLLQIIRTSPRGTVPWRVWAEAEMAPRYEATKRAQSIVRVQMESWRSARRRLSSWNSWNSWNRLRRATTQPRCLFVCSRLGRWRLSSRLRNLDW